MLVNPFVQRSKREVAKQNHLKVFYHRKGKFKCAIPRWFETDLFVI